MDSSFGKPSYSGFCVRGGQKQARLKPSSPPMRYLNTDRISSGCTNMFPSALRTATIQSCCARFMHMMHSRDWSGRVPSAKNASISSANKIITNGAGGRAPTGGGWRVFFSNSVTNASHWFPCLHGGRFAMRCLPCVSGRIRTVRASCNSIRAYATVISGRRIVGGSCFKCAYTE